MSECYLPGFQYSHVGEKQREKEREKARFPISSYRDTNPIMGTPSSWPHLNLIISPSESRSVCLTPCDPMDCSPPGFSFHEIIQARILEWVASPFARGSSQPRDQTQVFRIAGRFFTIWATGKSMKQITSHRCKQMEEYTLYRRRQWQPTPIFLPEEFYGQRSLLGYSPCSRKELDKTEWLTHTL